MDDGPVISAGVALLRVSESWRKLKGLDAPAKHEVRTIDADRRPPHRPASKWASGIARRAARFLSRARREERERLLQLLTPPRPVRQWATPGDLAQAVDPSTVQTPALDLIDEALVWAYTTPGARLMISIAAAGRQAQRVTKIGSLWALTRNPELRIGIASYAQSLAEGFGREIRNMITTFNGDDGTLDLGLRIAPDYGSAKRWQLDGHRGGVVCVGIGSGLTGRPLDALVDR